MNSFSRSLAFSVSVGLGDARRGPHNVSSMAEAVAAFAETKQYTPALDDVLQEIATSGQTAVAWEPLQLVLAAKLEAVLNEYHEKRQDLNEPFDEMVKRCLALLAEFPSPPFTLQRFCELLIDPHRIYATSTRKVGSALEKLLTVSSTVATMGVQNTKPGTYQVRLWALASPALVHLPSSAHPFERSPATLCLPPYRRLPPRRSSSSW